VRPPLLTERLSAVDNRVSIFVLARNRGRRRFVAETACGVRLPAARLALDESIDVAPCSRFNRLTGNRDRPEACLSGSRSIVTGAGHFLSHESIALKP
jgi:hypothetical protein